MQKKLKLLGEKCLAKIEKFNSVSRTVWKCSFPSRRKRRVRTYSPGPEQAGKGGKIVHAGLFVQKQEAGDILDQKLLHEKFCVVCV